MKVQVESLPEVFKEVFDFAHRYYATDVYVKEDVPVFFKLIGISGTALKIARFYDRELPSSEEREISEYLKRGVTKGDVNGFLEVLRIQPGQEIDTSFTLLKNDKYLGRYRLNVAPADGGTVLTMRRLFSYVPHFQDDLRLPEVLAETREWSSGLVVVTGPTGSGKSTTLASIMRYLGEDADKARVIITVEKPIEYVFENKGAFFIQREVGRDTENFVSGIHNALRQHPDVIYVGESRTPEEIKATLMASETGHLTFTTLHTASAWGAISRIIDVFPPDEQPQIKTILADQLRLVVAQRLITTVDYAVRVVTEVLYVDEYVRQRIKEGDVKSIREYVYKGDREGRRWYSLNSELTRLVQEGFVSPETAFKVTYDPKDLKNRLGRGNV